jgi:hypothetical protein
MSSCCVNLDMIYLSGCVEGASTVDIQDLEQAPGIAPRHAVYLAILTSPATPELGGRTPGGPQFLQ